MQTRKTIAIIGATGNMGSAISRSLSKGNYRLLLSANVQDKVQSLVREIKTSHPSADVDTVESALDAGWEADIIILAIPYPAEKTVAVMIGEVLTQKIVVSISNPLHSTYDALAGSPETSAAEELQRLLPYSKVIKAFNTSPDFSIPVIDGRPMDVYIAGDDDPSLQVVAELVSTAGFNPVIAGALAASRILEKIEQARSL